MTTKQMTLAEQYADLIAGKYTGSPGVLWNVLSRTWRGTALTDREVDILLVEAAVETRVDPGKHGGADVQISCPMYDIADALERRDAVAMMVQADRAEELGISPELCDLTRQALRAQCPEMGKA